MVVNVTAAVGALICGHLQDKIGVSASLGNDTGTVDYSILPAFFATESVHVWIAGNIIGAAVGSSQSVSRALVSKFTPADRSGEFLGLWGVVIRLSVIVGP